MTKLVLQKFHKNLEKSYLTQHATFRIVDVISDANCVFLREKRSHVRYIQIFDAAFEVTRVLLRRRRRFENIALYPILPRSIRSKMVGSRQRFKSYQFRCFVYFQSEKESTLYVFWTRKATIRPKRQFVPSDNSSQIPKGDNSSQATIRPKFQKATIRPK